MKLHSFDNTTTLNQYFADELTTIIRQAIDSRGHAYLVVSGGNTPVPLFDELSNKPLDWKHVTITLTDERRVPSRDKDSNERLVHDHLLKNHAASAEFVSLQQGSEEDIANLPMFDAVILGMGEDGHTASLFPCSPEIQIGLDDATTTATLIVNPGQAPYQRISLTKNRLQNSRHIFLHLVGEKKLAVLNKAMADNDILAMPIRAFLQNSKIDVQVMYST